MNSDKDVSTHSDNAAEAEAAEARIEAILEGIAKAKLQIPTLRERRADRLDFHEVSVWGLRRALLAAYQAGRNDAR